MAASSIEYNYKVILLGGVGVGKTALFNRIKLDEFHENVGTAPSTIGSDVYRFSTTIGDDKVNVSLWDTAGAELFSTLPTNYYRDTSGALLVYCVEDNYTFESLQEWIDDADRYINSEETVWALIGNKCDLYNEVEEYRVAAQCKRMSTDLCYQCSAKTGENVMEAFQDIIASIHKNQAATKLQQSTKGDQPINIYEEQKSSHRCSC